MNKTSLHGSVQIIVLTIVLIIVLVLTVTASAAEFTSRTTAEPLDIALNGTLQTQSITSPPSPEEATSTPTVLPTLTVIPSITLTATITITQTPTYPEATATPTPEPTWTLSPSLTITSTPPMTSSTAISVTSATIFLPIINRSQPVYVPATKALFCDQLSASLAIPDDTAGGVNNSISISDPSQIVDLDVSVDINHPRVGDLRVMLTHQETGKTITLIDRPGAPPSPGCTNANIKTILDDEIASKVSNKCAASPAAISGIYIPEVPLGNFDGENITGNWVLNVSDHTQGETGRLNAWCLVATISISPPPPTPTPPPPPFPSQRILSGVTGQGQALPLDCESRSAVDWAHYFGYNIGEINFFNHLPVSDNPDKGFVGDVYGQWGQIPPHPYGVHAEPVAELLRQYGVSAYAHRPLSWDMLRAEIGSGRPVMVWIVGSVVNGIPVYITPSDGLHTIVARFEHTVLVTGYTASTVYFLNGGTIYTTSVSQFLDSWSAMGDMAITAQP